ncbi:hypothetical protein ACIQU5_28000 [Streptomyces sp. NPDC090306]|uniref:hypothetical protein n=1 Tax=Streptomyces sp. NPDC090306 TaxID=3365961 RepID=UPI003815D633
MADVSRLSVKDLPGCKHEVIRRIPQLPCAGREFLEALRIRRVSFAEKCVTTLKRSDENPLGQLREALGASQVHTGDRPSEGADCFAGLELQFGIYGRALRAQGLHRDEGRGYVFSAVEDCGVAGAAFLAETMPHVGRLLDTHLPAACAGLDDGTSEPTEECPGDAESGGPHCGIPLIHAPHPAVLEVSHAVA